MEPMSELVPSSSIRTFLLIENRLLREALVRLFSKRADLLVVGQSGYAEATALTVLDSKCDVLIVDSLQIPRNARRPGNVSRRISSRLRRFGRKQDRHLRER